MPGVLSPDEFVRLLPKAIAWTEKQEKIILGQGVPLLPDQISIARHIGVARPEDVRVLQVGRIKLPDDPDLRNAAIRLSLINENTNGLTVRYGIFIHQRQWNRRPLIAHELQHVAQFETLGGIPQFLQAYMGECNAYGYKNAPMERAAIAREAEFPDI